MFRLENDVAAYTMSSLMPNSGASLLLLGRDSYSVPAVAMIPWPSKVYFLIADISLSIYSLFIEAAHDITSTSASDFTKSS